MSRRNTFHAGWTVPKKRRSGGLIAANLSKPKNDPIVETADRFGPVTTAPVAGTGTLDLPAAPVAKTAKDYLANPSTYRDSDWSTAMANLLNADQTGRSNLDTADRRAKGDRDENVSLLAEGKGKSRNATTQNANNQGLFYSGILGKRLGDVDTDYGRRTADVNKAFTQGTQDRATAHTNLGSTYAQGQTAATNQAIQRALARDAVAPVAEAPSSVNLDALIKALSAGMLPGATTRNARR